MTRILCFLTSYQQLVKSLDVEVKVVEKYSCFDMSVSKILSNFVVQKN